MGSGTTGVAAARLKRRFIGCDIDEKCVGIARHRIATEGLTKTG
jgi:DNA modification methylase